MRNVRPATKSTKVSETLILSEFHDGFWLYDTTRRMNLAMRDKTPEDAFVTALTYYQNRLAVVEYELKHLKDLVGSFVENFIEDDEDEG